ncbi:Serine proteinase stubble [Hypsibius exemplaris]|uniref:Serine proteinase stubble n=1 Tax=Hypsibius exemplaris TaxID=2072580 RepID=A0A1W0XEJ7_HYPEX|nr:Serine proteinase stubble [Hypsibius exemplaris]
MNSDDAPLVQTNESLGRRRAVLVTRAKRRSVSCRLQGFATCIPRTRTTVVLSVCLLLLLPTVGASSSSDGANHGFSSKTDTLLLTGRSSGPALCLTQHNDVGVCVFLKTCLEMSGQLMGTCAKSFFFASCCLLPNATSLASLNVTYGPTNPKEALQQMNFHKDTNLLTNLVSPPNELSVNSDKTKKALWPTSTIMPTSEMSSISPTLTLADLISTTQGIAMSQLPVTKSIWSGITSNSGSQLITSLPTGINNNDLLSTTLGPSSTLTSTPSPAAITINYMTVPSTLSKSPFTDQSSSPVLTNFTLQSVAPENATNSFTTTMKSPVLNRNQTNAGMMPTFSLPPGYVILGGALENIFNLVTTTMSTTGNFPPAVPIPHIAEHAHNVTTTTALVHNTTWTPLLNLEVHSTDLITATATAGTTSPMLSRLTTVSPLNTPLTMEATTITSTLAIMENTTVNGSKALSTETSTVATTTNPITPTLVQVVTTGTTTTRLAILSASMALLSPVTHNLTTTAPLTSVEATSVDTANSSSTSSPDSEGQTPVTLSDICGITPLLWQRDSGRDARIVGGSEAKMGEFPWQVSLRRIVGLISSHRCGAALVHPRWVITAAHCASDIPTNRMIVRIGEYDFRDANSTYPHVDIRVAERVIHQKFNFLTFENDVALLRLAEPVKLGPHIIPVCLAPFKNYTGSYGTISGWGRLSQGGALPPVLHKVDVPFIAKKECESWFDDGDRHQDIEPVFICAGYKNGGRDACQGDSGGPVVQKVDGRWGLVGVISWGIGCADPNLPGVSTLIPLFADWIKNNSEGDVYLPDFYSKRASVVTDDEDPPSIRSRHNGNHNNDVAVVVIGRPPSLILWTATFLFLGFIAILLIGVWIAKNRGGLIWADSNPTFRNQMFNYHPFFMILGLLYIHGIANLLYRLFPTANYLLLRIVHGILQLSGVVFVGLGFYAVYFYKEKSPRHGRSSAAVHFLSTHSWMGLTLLTIMALQFVCGFFGFLLLGLKGTFRQGYTAIHRFTGVTVFLLACGTALVGLDQLRPTAIILNSLALIISGYAINGAYILAKKEYERTGQVTIVEATSDENIPILLSSTGRRDELLID